MLCKLMVAVNLFGHISDGIKGADVFCHCSVYEVTCFFHDGIGIVVA